MDRSRSTVVYLLQIRLRFWLAAAGTWHRVRGRVLQGRQVLWAVKSTE